MKQTRENIPKTQKETRIASTSQGDYPYFSTSLIIKTKFNNNSKSNVFKNF